MSNFRGHLIGAILLDIILLVGIFYVSKYYGFNFWGYLKNNYWFLTLLIAISLLFSLFPDIDTNSVASHFFYLLFFILDLIIIFYFKNYKLASIFGLVLMLPSISKHRGFTHSKLFALIICSILFLILPMILYKKIIFVGLPYFVAAIIGYYSHLLFDGKMF